MKHEKCSLHARLQRRIANRTMEIQTVVAARVSAKLRGNSGQYQAMKQDLKDLESQQKLDKEIISNVYWGNY